MTRHPHFHKTTTELAHMILQEYFNSGNVDVDKTLEEFIMSRRAEMIKKHEKNHSIWYSDTRERWCTKLGSGAEKRMLVRKERRDLENAIIEFYLADERLTATVDDVFQNWIQYESERTDHTAKTINEYENEYKKYLAGTDFASLPIHTITEMDIVRLLRMIVTEGEKIPQKRYAAVKTVIRALFNYARIYMEIDCISVKNIMDDLRFPNAAFKKTITDDTNQIFKHSEVKLIKDALKDTENLLELGILLAIETGVRVGELCTLKRECLNGDYLLIKFSEHKCRLNGIYQYYIGAPKKNKERDVVLNDDAKRIVQKILSLHDSEWLFPDQTDTTQWRKAHCFDGAIRRVCKRLGIAKRSMHKLRKTYASYILENRDKGVTDKIAQVQLGHNDIDTTHKAYYYDIYDKKEKVNILSSITIG